MPCTFFHFILKPLLPIGLGFASPFCGPKGQIHTRMSFLLPFLLFPITQGLFFCQFFWQEFIAESLTRRLFVATNRYLACYKQVDLPATWLLLKPLHMGIVAVWLSNFGMFSGKFVVTFGSNVPYGVANNSIKVIIIKELVEEIFCCSIGIFISFGIFIER